MNELNVFFRYKPSPERKHPSTSQQKRSSAIYLHMASRFSPENAELSSFLAGDGNAGETARRTAAVLYR